MGPDAGAMGFTVIFLFILFIAIGVAVSRWIFRINDIIKRLDQIVSLLDGKPEKPKSFIDGVKKGMGN